ncbi:bifunctional 4-hydroxy-2-oxoglutarate aldolase/2-dehydro-3-deoxy-phosphogluconate aldolase [Microbacterium sp. LWS13-1.2]|uniref:Bifunctional 4-hydroxy-2-oxoglutarate aldolase/2-dehydro-3-deoxy-phosphogluconate aldolase n=1 Tax=Microbacterium sp. LWS13-1.2 TaxID=3135264 RepID=A0AAU6SEE3_9MICO
MPLPESTRRQGVIAVVRTRDVSQLSPLLEALCEAGLATIELTMTTPGVLNELAALIRRFDEACIGVGTLHAADDAERALDAGARFLVTPSAAPAVAEIARPRGGALLAGALTPTEIVRAWNDGASCVKVFPAQTVGPNYVRHIHGPYPDIPLVPSGGVGLEDIVPWITAGADAVSIGGPLIGGATEGDLTGLSARVRRALDLVVAARSS